MRIISKYRDSQCLLFLVLALAFFQGEVVKAQVAFDERQRSDESGPVHVLKEKYEMLPPAGKFVATAAAGFVGSRLALKTFVRAAKVAGCVFIASEVLSASGALDDMPPYIDEQVQAVAGAKNRVLREARKLHNGVREQLKKEKMAAIGFASGAFVGMAL